MRKYSNNKLKSWIIERCKICGKFIGSHQRLYCPKDAYLKEKKIRCNYHKRWQKENKDKHNEANQRYYRSHKEKVLICIKKWKSNHKENVKRWDAKYYRKKKKT